MEKINLNLDQLLRYYFAGALGIISWCYLECKFEIIHNQFSTFSLIIPLLTGSIVYVFHRSLLYPAIYFILSLIASIAEGIKKGDISSTMWQRDFRRWKQMQNKNSYQNNLKEWASQVHFIYCSCWTILLSTIASQRFDYTVENFKFNIISFCFIILFVSGVIHHYRFLIYDNLSVEEDRKTLSDDNENTKIDSKA